MKTGLLKCFNAEYLDLWIEGQVYWTFTDNQRQNEFREERYWGKNIKGRIWTKNVLNFSFKFPILILVFCRRCSASVSSVGDISLGAQLVGSDLASNGSQNHNHYKIIKSSLQI